MRAHRITSTGEATPGGRRAATRRVGMQAAVRAVRVAAGHAGGFCIAAGLTIGVAAAPAAAAAHCAPAHTPASALRPADACASGPDDPAPVATVARPADVAADHAGSAPAAQDGATRPLEPVAPPAAAGPLGRPLGRAVGMLPTRHARGRGHRASDPAPGCTGMATLDGVSAALQAGPFGRRKRLAIMQFRNVMTDSAADGRVACHSDVLLSDGSLHRAEFGLRQLRHGTRLHIEVAGEREDAGSAGVGTPAPEPPASAAPDAGASGAAPLPEEPAARLPAT